MTYLLFVATTLIFYFRFRESIVGGLPAALVSLLSTWVFFSGAALVAHLISMEASNGYLTACAIALGVASLWRRPAHNASHGEQVSIAYPVALTAVLLVIFYLQNQFGKQIKYISSDPAGHFDMAWTYAKNRYLLLDKQSRIFSYDTYPPLFYVNAGLLFGTVDNVSATSLIRKYNLINFLALMVAALQVLCLCEKIAGKPKWLAFVVAIAIVIGHPLDIYFSGFSSQLIGLTFILGIVISMTHGSKNPSALLQNILLLGLYLSYFYYIPFVILATFAYQVRENRQSRFVAEVFVFLKKFSPFFVCSISMLPAYAKAAKVISVNGAMFTDLYLSFLIFTPAVVWLFWCKKYKETEFFLLSGLIFWVALVLFRAAGIVSVYYVFKIYAVIYIFMGLCSLRAFVSVDARKVAAVYGLIGAPLLLISDKLYSETVTSKNYFVMKSNYQFLTKQPIFDVAQMSLISELNTIPGGWENVCLTSDTHLQLMWFVELTGGAYFRGKGDSHFLWSKDQTWNDVNRDPQCHSSEYAYVVDLHCTTHDEHNVIATPAGCIRQVER